MCYLCLLIQPGVIAKAFNLSEAVARFNIFYVEVYGISELLRTVPTFVSAHTFCASRKAYSKRDKFLIVGKSLLDFIIAKPEKRSPRR